MSSFFILSTAVITLSAFDGSVISFGTTVGTICHEQPNLSFSQPHCCAFSSPPSRKLSQ